MEQKIREYVNYQLRFDKRDDIDELKEEIIANLTDRYNDLLNQYNDQEKAYVEAIKQMGDFSGNCFNNVPDDFSIKPSIPDIALLIGAILSVFGLLFLFINTALGAVITVISIITFSGTAYYLYSYSQYVRKNHMDIDKHNALLKKIFKNMKTSFVFWSISLSIILSKIVMSIVGAIIIFFYTADIDINDPTSITMINPRLITFITVVLFVILLIIFLSIFNNIYNNLIDKYYFLTGETSLQGSIEENFYLLRNKKSKEQTQWLSNIINYKYLIPIFGLLYIIPSLLFRIKINYSSGSSGITIILGAIIESLVDSDTIFIAIPILLLSIAIIFIIIRSLIKKERNDVILIVSYYLWFIFIGSIFSSGPRYTLPVGSQKFHFFAVVLLTILLLIRLITKIGKKTDK